MDVTRTRISAVIIKDKKILLVKGNSGFYKDFFFTPGGKVEEGESEMKTLERELKEELSTGLIEAKKYFEYVAKSYLLFSRTKYR